MNTIIKDKKIILQGHRGCTGYYPENSIEGFIYALEIGVTALEIDVVVSKDNQLIVSHDPFFKSETCLDSRGKRIPKEEEKQHKIYAKTVSQIKAYSCINDERYSEQISLTHQKPTLSELIETIKKQCKKNNKRLPQLTIEIKSRVEWEQDFQPNLTDFIQIIDQFHKKRLEDFDVLYHSFDIRILREMSQLGYKKLDYLIEDKKVNIDELILNLDFNLSGFGIYHRLVDRELVDNIMLKGKTLSVWTVNSEEKINELLALGVTNIITDYPKMARKKIESSGGVVV